MTGQTEKQTWALERCAELRDSDALEKATAAVKRLRAATDAILSTALIAARLAQGLRRLD